MRVDLLFKKTATFELWDFTSTQSGTGEITRNYTLKGTYNAMVIPLSSGTTHLMTDQPLAVYQQVRNVRDRNGNLVAGTTLYVHSVDAQMDPFGVVIGFKNTVRDNVPRDIVESVSAFRNTA